MKSFSRERNRLVRAEDGIWNLCKQLNLIQIRKANFTFGVTWSGTPCGLEQDSIASWGMGWNYICCWCGYIPTSESVLALDSSLKDENWFYGSHQFRWLSQNFLAIRLLGLSVLILRSLMEVYFYGMLKVKSTKRNHVTFIMDIQIGLFASFWRA